MKRKLEGLYDKLYDSKFDFQKLLPDLSIEFFRLPLQPREMQVLNDIFSKKVSESKVREEFCPICYVNYEPKDIVTKLPICNHEFHFGCLKTWLVENSLCPICRGFVRAKMIEHFHGEFEIPKEILAEENDDQDLHGNDVQVQGAENPNNNLQNEVNVNLELPLVELNHLDEQNLNNIDARV